MKKQNRFLLAIAIVILGYVNLNFIIVQSSNISDLQVSNIAALAEEGGGETLDCWQIVWSTGDDPIVHKIYCGDCSSIPCRGWRYASTCVSNPPPQD